jgi:BA14K-like protein
MEPTMINLKVLSTAAAMALALPLVLPGESFAQERTLRGGAPAAVGGGGGAPARAFVGGGSAQQFRGGAASRPTFGGGGGGGAPSRAFVGGGSAPQFGGGVSRPTFSGGVSRPTFSGGGVASGPRYSGGYDGGYRYHRRHGGGGFIPGAVAGAVIGGALASQSYGYYDPGYYSSYGYYDDGYYDDGAVAAAPAPGDDSVAYCMQTYKSYDPASGTYLGYDGLRHPCP